MTNSVKVLANYKYQRGFYTLEHTANNGDRNYSLKYSTLKDKDNLLTQLIRFEHHKGLGYQNKPRKPFGFWLILRTQPNWNKCKERTGLLKAKNRFSYYGDIPKIENEKRTPQHLIILQFSGNAEIIILDIFKDFYPKKTVLNHILQTHNYVYNKQLNVNSI